MCKDYNKNQIRRIIDDFLRISQVVITSSGYDEKHAEFLASLVGLITAVISEEASHMRDCDRWLSVDDPPELF